jgi:hypothetical protein
LKNKVRTCEIGILFDPNRPSEAAFAKEFRIQLKKLFPYARIKMNYPYRGTSDGHTTQLRSLLAEEKYSGIEIEMNQNWLKKLAKKRLLNQTTKAIALAVSNSLVNCQSRTDKKVSKL